MREKILNYLRSSNDNYISGQKISEQLGISRNAVWKHINILKEEGYKIESVSNRGYRLIESPDILSKAEIKRYLDTTIIGKEIIYFDTIDSTNNYAKKIASDIDSDGVVVVSEEQTLGRGRMNRLWTSPKYKGIWMSIILKPDFPTYKAPQITQVMAVAILKAFEKYGIDAKIKWPNDIVINKKKVCGILTEMSGEIEKLNYIIIGIGINVNLDISDFNEELIDKASSLKIEAKRNFDRAELIAEVMKQIERYYFKFLVDDLDEITEMLNSYSLLLNQEATINLNGKEYIGKVLNINRDGSLEVEIDGNVRKIISGEVSIRGLYKYID